MFAQSLPRIKALDLTDPQKTKAAREKKALDQMWNWPRLPWFLRVTETDELVFSHQFTPRVSPNASDWTWGAGQCVVTDGGVFLWQ